jgi:hypothetical protein
MLACSLSRTTGIKHSVRATTRSRPSSFNKGSQRLRRSPLAGEVPLTRQAGVSAPQEHLRSAGHPDDDQHALTGLPSTVDPNGARPPLFSRTCCARRRTFARALLASLSPRLRRFRPGRSSHRRDPQRARGQEHSQIRCHSRELPAIFSLGSRRRSRADAFHRVAFGCSRHADRRRG